jgi:UDP-glucose 4-epimerase
VNIPDGMRVFITGGAGFIGSRLASALVDRNEVVVFDNLMRDSLSASAVRDHPNLRLIVGDIMDVEALKDAMRGADIIIHCAGIAGIDTVTRSPTRTMQVNMIGSANVLQAASEQSGVTRIVCFSTSEVFGQHAFESREGDRTVIGAVGEARWTYAVSKLAEEHLAIAYFQELGLPTTVVRPFNVYGPGQVGEGALSIFVQRAIADQVIEVHGSGSQIRAWCYVDDMVDAVLLAMVHPAAVGESFNIGNRRSVETIYRLATTVVRVTASSSEIVLVPRDEPDVELRIPSVDKARDLIGFDAKVDLEEGIARTAAFYRSIRQELAPA